VWYDYTTLFIPEPMSVYASPHKPNPLQLHLQHLSPNRRPSEAIHHKRKQGLARLAQIVSGAQPRRHLRIHLVVDLVHPSHGAARSVFDAFGFAPPLELVGVQALS
jgi:hypothetical protein